MWSQTSRRQHEINKNCWRNSKVPAERGSLEEKRITSPWFTARMLSSPTPRSQQSSSDTFCVTGSAFIILQAQSCPQRLVKSCLGLILLLIDAVVLVGVTGGSSEKEATSVPAFMCSDLQRDGFLHSSEGEHSLVHLGVL